MIFAGELGVSQAPIYTVPDQIPSQTINLLRIVNDSGAPRTFTIWINNGSGAQPATPIDTQLPIGALWDDLPEFQLRDGATIEAAANDIQVKFVINAQNTP